MTGPFRAFLARPNDDAVKVFGVAFLTALACALVISGTAVALRPLQQANIAAERAARIEAMLDTLPGLRDLMLETGVDALQSRVIDLATGAFVTGIDPAGLDLQALAQDPETSVALATGADLASIRRRATIAPVYLLEKDGNLALLVLPVYGAGYSATITAMLALQPDLETIAALTILQTADTPGLGARILEPAWQAQWTGKSLSDETGALAIAVVKSGAATPYQVDGITGATRTSNGVQFMLRFWLGPDGYGPFLAALRERGL